VEVNTDGVPVRYHVSNKHPGNLRTAGSLKWEAVPARTDDGRPLVIHLFERTRPEQTRGIPFLAPVVEHLKQLSTYSKAEVDAAVVSSFVTGVVQTPLDEDETPVVGERDSGLAANEVKLGQGAMISLAPGETFTSFNPARPNGNFDPFVQAFCREIGVALELPQELLLKHFTASYSASRAALEMAWQTFRKNRNWFAGRFCQPLYEWMMEEAVASGRLARPGFFADPLIRAAYCGAEWIGPQRASLNPKQESDADAQDVREGFKTIEQVCMERTGGEFEKKNEQRGKEVRLRKVSGAQAPPPQPLQPGTRAEADVDADDGDEETETKPKKQTQQGTRT
jgi:lambda family phage portal protein